MDSVPYLPDITERLRGLPFERRPVESLAAKKLAEKIRAVNEKIPLTSKFAKRAFTNYGDDEENTCCNFNRSAFSKKPPTNRKIVSLPAVSAASTARVNKVEYTDSEDYEEEDHDNEVDDDKERASSRNADISNVSESRWAIKTKFGKSPGSVLKRFEGSLRR